MNGARCPICANPRWHRRGRGRECTHCGLELDDDRPIDGVRDEIARWLGADVAGSGWRVAGGAARNAAWALGFVADGAGWRPARACRHDVTLAIMARAAEARAVARQAATLGFPRSVLLFDGDIGEDARAGAGATIAMHPLGGDFSSQRNRLQAMVGTGWALHLDSDEMPSPGLIAALGWLTAAADADGLRALGLPRRNLVDGVLSALYPDIQYRLVRADVRFASRVHERPVMSFAETSLALAGAIEHRLSSDRVRERTRAYGAMAAEGARHEDEEALLAPYRGPPIAAS